MSDFFEELLSPLNFASFVIVVAVVVAGLAYLVLRPKFFRLMLKNLGRNPIRTSLIAVAISVLVAMVTLIWTVVFFIDEATRERAKDLKLIVSEKRQLPSQLPITHADLLDPDSPSQISELRGKYTSRDFMTWSFFGGTTHPTIRNMDTIVFFFSMNPDHIKTMMEEMENFDDALIAKLKSKKNACLMGRDRMAKINRKVGETFKVYSFNYKGIDLDFEIVGQLPDGRYNQSAIMRNDYFLGAFDAYEREKGQKHPLHKNDSRLNLVWLRVPDRATFNEVGAIIEKHPGFSQRPVRVETAATGIGGFLEPFADLFRGVKYVLVPAILIIMSLVVAIAISISVRERRTEIAVMKVLGFSPNQVLILVLGESLILGLVSGFVASGFMYAIINPLGGLPFQVAFFPAFLIRYWALFWGPAMGAFCAVVGSFFPAQQARAVKVSEVFSKVA